MGAPVTHQWMYNASTDGYWQCPARLVDTYLAQGWVACEAPPESNAHLYDDPADPRVVTPSAPRLVSTDAAPVTRTRKQADARPRRSRKTAVEKAVVEHQPAEAPPPAAPAGDPGEQPTTDVPGDPDTTTPTDSTTPISEEE